MYTLREIRIGKAAAVNNNRIRFSCPINNKDGTLIMFTLTTDTSIDVFRNKLDELGVYWVPLTYTIDGVVYEDNFSDDEHYKAFYDKIRAGALPVTSQINPYTHEEFWEKVIEKAGKNDIVHLTLSSGLSETYSSACKAAQNFMEKHHDVKIYVVDTLGATQAAVPVFEKALSLRDQGVRADIAAESLRAYTHRIQVYVVADDLFHLKRGGRVSAAAAIIGSMISIKPLIVLSDAGKLVVYKKPLGWKKAVKMIFDHIDEYCAEPNTKKFWIAHADCLDKAEEVKKAIEARYPGATVQIGWIGPVIGAHTGCGTLGVLFEGNSRLL